MLAELLEELTPQLIRRLQTERAPDLVRELVATLRRQHVDPSACDSLTSIGSDVASVLGALHSIRESIYDAIEERDLVVPPRELRLVTEWLTLLTERTLRQENRRYVTMLDALPDLISLQDSNGRFIFLNRASGDTASAMTGVPRDRLLGGTFRGLGFPDTFVQYMAGLTEQVRLGQPVKDEFVLPMPDGGRWWEHDIAPVFDAQGKVEAIAYNCRDIHGRKVAEARLQLLSRVGLLAEHTETK
jgi:PAS domain S-box-containing protein